MAGKIFRMGFAILVTGLVARHLGPEAFGELNFFIALSSLFAVFGSLGLKNETVHRLVSGPQNNAGRVLGSVLAAQSLSGLAIWALWVLLLKFGLGVRPEAQVVGALVGLGVILRGNEALKYYFESKVRSKYIVGAETFGILFAGFGRIGFVMQGAGLIYFGLAQAMETLAALGMLFWFYCREPVKRLRVDPPLVRKMIRCSWPLLLSSFSVSIMMRVDQVMIEYMQSMREVGIYSSAVRMAEPLRSIGFFLASSALPGLLALTGSRQKSGFLRVFRIGFFGLLCLSLFIWILREWIVGLVLGEDYISGALVLGILVFSLPVSFISMMSVRFFVFQKNYLSIFSRQATGAIMNVVVNLYMIPRYGITGAAVSTLITSMTVAFAMDPFTIRGRELLRWKLEALGIPFRNK